MRISSRDFGGLHEEDSGIAHRHPSWIFAEEWVIKGSNVLVRQASSMPTTLSCPELSLSPSINPSKGSRLFYQSQLDGSVYGPGTEESNIPVSIKNADTPMDFLSQYTLAMNANPGTKLYSGCQKPAIGVVKQCPTLRGGAARRSQPSRAAECASGVESKRTAATGESVAPGFRSARRAGRWYPRGPP
jgi:hypothetical protein